MNTKNKKKYSFQTKTFIYVLIFNVLVIILLWFCQISIFDIYYEKYQIDILNNMAINIKNEPEDNIINALETAAYQNDVCITVTSQNEYLAKFNTQMDGCVFENNRSTTKKMITNFIASNMDSKTYKFINEDRHVSAMLYALKYQDKYIFMYSNLEDISMVTTVVRKQLLYLSIVAILIAVVVSIFLSDKITNPIKKITKKAQLLGKGNYDVEFDESDIKEVNDLSITLSQAKEELSKTDELRRDLMANVSHDLKTPLTMIKAYAEMIKDISYKDKKKMNEHLDIIIDETDRLTLLVNDILKLSELQTSGDQTLEITEFDLVKEINNIIKKYEIIKETENYIFDVNMPEEVIIKADKNRLNQVIYNLINNAINYTGEDKKVSIKITKIKKDYKIEISDTGKGIKKEEIPFIWDKYYKMAKEHRRNVVSTGLGLSICKQILIEHNYEYGVKSSSKGTTFYFIIPGE